MMRGRPLAFLMAAGLALAGCSSIGDPIEAIGGRAPAPDEFRVLPRKPLIVPDNVAGASSLPRPDPGQVSPLEPNPQAEAVAALLGPDAAAPRSAGGAPTAGEEALLGAARASAASPEIRTQLEKDKVTRADSDANKPYEPPTLAELFFGKGEDQPDPATVLDPVAESQRLQREGVAAPNDPEAAAAAGGEEAATPEPVQRQYDSVHDRRPQSPVVGKSTTPAYE